MPSSTRKAQRRPEGESPRVPEGEDDASGTQSSTRGHRTDFRPPRSRTPTSSRHGSVPSRNVSQELPSSLRGTTVQWSQEQQTYREGNAEIPNVFSPRSSAKVSQIGSKFNPSRIFMRLESDPILFALIVGFCCHSATTSHKTPFFLFPIHSIISLFYSSFIHLLSLTKIFNAVLFRAPRHPTNNSYQMVYLFFGLYSHCLNHSPNRDLSLYPTAITITAPTAFSKSSCALTIRFVYVGYTRTHLFGCGSQPLVPQMHQASWIQSKTTYCTAVTTLLLTLKVSTSLRMFSIFP